MLFAVLLLMSKLHVGIQTNQGSSSENCCTLQFVYQIYTRCKAQPDSPLTEHEKFLKFIKYLKGVRLNGGV